MMNVIGLIGGMSWNSTSERVMRGNTCLECVIRDKKRAEGLTPSALFACLFNLWA